MFNGRTILVTGGTGSFGRMFIKRVFEEYSPKKIIVFSRDEMKQFHMSEEFKDKRLRYFIGDVRDKDRLKRAMSGVDFVVHAAALKIVPFAEYNPFEYIKTNINGAMNVIDAAIDCGVEKVVALSTDKAANPVNLYGATKLCSDKLFVAGNAYVGEHTTRFSVVRYGNVIGSRGSAIPFFKDQAKTGFIPITDERMTRFWITLEEAVDLVWTAFETMLGGEIYVKKLPSMSIMQLADAFGENIQVKIIGIRPGEKLHETMISEYDSPYTYEYEGYYKILPNIYDCHKNAVRIGDGKKVSEGFEYRSDNNPEWISVSEMKEIITRVQ